MGKRNTPADVAPDVAVAATLLRPSDEVRFLRAQVCSCHLAQPVADGMPGTSYGPIRGTDGFRRRPPVYGPFGTMLSLSDGVGTTRSANADAGPIIPRSLEEARSRMAQERTRIEAEDDPERTEVELDAFLADICEQ